MVEIIDKLKKIEILTRNANWHMAIEEARDLRSNNEPDIRHILLASGLCVPNVLLAGPARTATTWLRGALGKHPNIRVALNEPHVLFEISDGNLMNCLYRYSRPELWRGKPKKNEILCEKSPSYICLPNNCIELIGALFPEMKIVFGCRDEISRLWSAINHLMSHFEFKGNWESFCYCYSSEIWNQIESGRIDYHLQRWRSVFPNENILVLSYSRISDDPRAVVDRVLRHVGARQTNDLFVHERSGIERRTVAVESKRVLDAPPENLFSRVYSILDSAK